MIGLVKHSDRHNVATLFTRERGRMAMLVPAASKSSRGAARSARLMPLSVISADVRVDATRELQTLRSPQRLRVWRDIYFNPVKSALALFLSEFLNAYLRYAESDPRLWDFIVDSLQLLDDAPGADANFHLAFLFGLLPYAGISPDIAGWRQGLWLDMRDGTLKTYAPLHRDRLTPEETAALPALMRLTPRNASRFKMNGAQRRIVLARLMQYYAVHFPGMSSLKSPEILRELFS